MSTKSLPGTSDHNIVLSSFKLIPSRKILPQRLICKYNKADRSNISEKNRQPEEDYFNRNPDTLSVEENCSFIEAGILKAFKEAVPSKLSRPKETYPWITPSVKRSQRRRDRLYIKAAKSKAPEDWNKVKYERQKTKHLIRTSHQNYIKEVIGENL